MLREVWQITKTPLLVYATEEAIQTPPAPLTGPLDRFTLADNKAFRQELHNETNQESEERRSGHALMDPISPSKRKHRSDSADSMNSNRASIGSDDGFASLRDPQPQAEPPLYSYASAAAAMATSASASVPQSDAPALPPRPPELSYSGAAQWSDIAKKNMNHGSMANGLEAQTKAGVGEKSPEMQERERPPSLFRFASGGGVQSIPGSDSMDMEMPKDVGNEDR